jgi:hypothetical protein
MIGMTVREDQTFEEQWVVAEAKQLVSGTAATIDQPETGRPIQQQIDMILLGAGQRRRRAKQE